MERVIILGSGGSGKSTLAARIGEIAALPLIELDKIFGQENLTATLPEQWIATQQRLAGATVESWMATWDRTMLWKAGFPPQTLLSFWISQSFAALGERFGDPVSAPTSGSGCFDIVDVSVRSL